MFRFLLYYCITALLMMLIASHVGIVMTRGRSANVTCDVRFGTMQCGIDALRWLRNLRDIIKISDGCYKWCVELRHIMVTGISSSGCPRW